jgi:DNA-directed RNA polymerase specialized sigma24 family protein
VAEVPKLSPIEWEDLLERLALHASNKLAKLYWRGAYARHGGAPPGAVEAADLAAEAITDLLDGVRTWDKTKCPSFTAFLMGVVDSKVNHLAESLENRRTRRFEEHGSGNGREISTEMENPAALVADEEYARLFHSALVTEIGDDPLALKLLECFEAGVTRPAEIAQLLGVDVSEINNAQKRLRRKAANVARIWEAGEQ